MVAESVRLSFGSTVALTAAEARIAKGTVTAIVGPSGSGKSTFLYCLAGLLLPDAGTVSFRGRDLSDLSDDQRSDLRRSSFGFVFQSADLVPELTLAENIELPLELNRVSRPNRKRRVADLVRQLGLDNHAGRRAAQVSGGQAQRAAVARAIAHRPAVVFADEPTGALDSANGQAVLGELIRLARTDGAAVVLVTHDREIAQSADAVLSMSDGRMLAA